jgi:anti-sigma-K factor RskA
MTALHDDILDLLAAYALDALEPEEIARLRALLDERPELRATLVELRATADKLPYGLPEATPPAELRQRVLDYATGRSTRAPTGATRLPRRGLGWLLGLGSLAAATAVAAAIGWGQALSLRGELAQAQADLVRTRTQLETVRAEQEQVAHVLLEAETLAVLQGTNGGGTLLRTPQGEALLVARLPPLQPGRVYQLWLIQGQNQPVSGGVFTVDQQGQGLLSVAPTQQVSAADTFAVTDEPGPDGSPRATSPILIVGTARAS